jgi:ATP-binding cassette subfamily B protein
LAAFQVSPEAPELFAASLHYNITYGKRDATRDEVDTAVRLADADGCIAAVSGGFSEEVGERGMTLSGGQQQRICLARAFLKNAPVVLLDEPTSSLDALSESEVLNRIRQMSRGKTVLLVTHRISALKNVDRILVLHEGVIIEDGTHAELISRNSLYHELSRRQTSATTRTEAAPHQLALQRT